MNHGLLRIIGFSLIVLSWILWAVIIFLPFFKLTLTQYAVVYPVILASTNIFWVGVAMTGKQFIQKFNIVSKVKNWLKRYHL
ncbi:MAG: hypothetical protein ACOYNU_03050 [Bacteroidales bacterium]